MATYTKGVVLALAVTLNAGGILGREATDERQLVERIVASWRARQKDIQTIRASARVDSFYSKGYLSAKTGASKYGPIPPEDTWIRGESQSWAIDFPQGRFAKESSKTYGSDPGDEDVPPQLVRRAERFLFKDGNYTHCIANPEHGPRPKGYTFLQHVHFSKYQGHAFVIWPDDVPLLWCAGGTITGDWPNPLQMLRVDAPEQFTFYGRATWQQRGCVLLRTRNQRSTTSVVEFWVDESSPHLIYRRRVVDFLQGGERLQEEIQVQYSQRQGQFIPWQWSRTCYEFWHDPNSVTQVTFTIQDIEFNKPLPDGLFTVRLEPGMGVIETDKSGQYVVDVDGKLVPYRGPEQQQRLLRSGQRPHMKKWTVTVILATTALAALAWLGHRWWKKRL